MCKSGNDLLVAISPPQMHAVHMALGIAGEAGELVDAIKKAAVYQKPLDLENVVEELGDLGWYMAGLRLSLGLTRDRVLAANMAKLEKRYPTKLYSDTDAQARADKAGA